MPGEAGDGKTGKRFLGMREREFNILRELAEKGVRGLPEGWDAVREYRDTYAALVRDGYVGDAGITAQGRECLEPFRVDNAIIMAAGYSARCMPLSNVMPKGLFRVKGEILIEREIEQLLQAGIEEIIVVTGFMWEKFQYLEEKYHVLLVHNPDYDKYNNMASLYAAREHMKNSYILCSDNYYEGNVFHRYLYAPHYSCVYSDAYCDEFCVTAVDGDGCITGIRRGGERAWYTIGDAYFDAALSGRFRRLMEDEWDDPQTRNMLMDDFHVRHIGELKLRKAERPGRSILEFDTLEEIREYDASFGSFIEENLEGDNAVIRTFSKYADVKSYRSVPTEQLGGRLHLNENLFGPSPKCLESLKEVTAEDLSLYDLSHRDGLVDALAESCAIPADNIFIHNGSAEVIKSVFSILLDEGDTVLVPEPGWSYYRSVADEKFAGCVTYEVREGEGSYEYHVEDLLRKAAEHRPKIIVVTLPHMPTGCGMSEGDVERVVAGNSGSVVMVDEAYWGYGDGGSGFERRIITKYSNVVVTRTFSKFYGLANIRIGYGLCSYPLRRTVGLDLPLFRACGISRRVALAAVRDRAYYDRMRVETVAVREWFTDALNAIPGVRAYRSEANFVFVCLQGADVVRVRAFMEENGILVRLFTDGDALRLRVTVAPRDVMERVLFQVRRALACGRA